MKELKVGAPVYVKDYVMRDGDRWSGWGILVSGPERDKTNLFTVLIHQFGACYINTKEVFTEVPVAPLRENKETVIADDDGREFTISYGEYEDYGNDKNRQFILGIDSDQEVISFALNNIDRLIESLEKVK